MSRSNLLSLLLAIVLSITTYSYVSLRIETSKISQENISKKDAILSVIHNRKSVRIYQDKEVSKEDLLTILKAGMAAPTAMDRRPWRFIAVTDTSVISRLNQKAPAVIVVCSDMEKMDEGASDFWITDASVASENMLLAIEGMGLGAVWKSVHPWKEYKAQVRSVLNLPENINPLCLIPIGYPLGDEKPKNKFDSSNIHWEEW